MACRAILGWVGGIGHNASRPSSDWSPPRVYPLVRAPICYNASLAIGGGVMTPPQPSQRGPVTVADPTKSRGYSSISRNGSQTPKPANP
eukprot:8272461-Pyramimonas_sp.AAC.1